MESEYPALDAMGIKNPHQITHYSVYQPAPDTDMLKVKYQRPAGSFLPVTRNYTFKRQEKQKIPDSATQKLSKYYEVSPHLTRALNELDSIVDQHQSVKEIQKHLHHELDRMQHDLQAEIESLRQLVKKLG